MNLEQALRQNLSHQWTVEEMAALVGLGTTLFNEKVKNYSGFSPINYLINIRISEAIKLLKRPDISLTDIALDTGFYSSQHFSTTFKKLTGYTPSEFRKNHLSKILILSKMKCIITIELGTNAVRVFAFDLKGNVIGSLKGYCPTFHAEPDYSEQDPEQIFITMLYVLKNLLNEKIHPKKYKVAYYLLQLIHA